MTARKPAKVREMFEATLGARYFYMLPWKPAPTLDYWWLGNTKLKPGDRVRVTVERLPRKEYK